MTPEAPQPRAAGGGKRRPDRSLFARAASAAVLAPAALGAAVIGGPVFAGVVAFMVLMMAFEWARMVEGVDFGRAFVALAIAGAASSSLAASGRYDLALGLCAIGGVAAAASTRARAAAGWAGFGAVYILAPGVALVWLRGAVEHGRDLTLALFGIVWMADTGAYFTGRIVGGPRVSRALSPEKTWSGVVGGTIMGAAAGAAATKLIYGEGSPAVFAAIGASLGLASILGDLTESAFKRLFGVKDSSNLIPGHGGFLDRLDGMIFATVAMTLGIFVHMIAWG